MPAESADERRQSGLSDEPGGCVATAKSRRGALGLAALCALLFFALALPQLDRFGPTWDTPLGEYAHGEQYLAYILSGDRAYLEFSADTAEKQAPRPEHRAPHPQYPARLFRWYETHPLGGLLSAVSCRIFFSELNWLPALPAHHLVILLGTAALLFVLVRFAALRFGAIAALGTAAALLLSPRFLADSFNNLKDAPEAALYALALIAYAAAFARPGAARFALAGALTGLALAQKANAYFIPLHALLYWALASLARRRRGVSALPWSWLGVAVAFVAGALAWLAVSPMLWEDTFARAWEHFIYFWRQGHIDFVGGRWDGVLAFVRTTPPALLLLALVGAFSPRLAGRDERWLLLLGLAVPLGRTTLPSAVNFDGVRHFLEFQPFLALLAGLGVAQLVRIVWRWAGSGLRARAITAGLMFSACFASPAWALASTWPYGTCYFNVFAGGFGGAQASGNLDASDYWANSYWDALAWLNEHAEPGAAVLVPVAEQVAFCAVPVRLRSDLSLYRMTLGAPPQYLYVLYITRPAFYGQLVTELEAHGTPAHAISVQGGVLSKIHRLADPVEIERALSLWSSNLGAHRASQRLRAWVESQPVEIGTRVMGHVLALLRISPVQSAEDPSAGAAEFQALLELLPAKLHADAAQILNRKL
ncbi:MAG: glycosyltransferase family 39 protein [Planctomycetota bacterium]